MRFSTSVAVILAGLDPIGSAFIIDTYSDTNYKSFSTIKC